jgi:MFS family permease
LVDRIGKGIRTAPRDAMIARTTPPDQLATAFGAHRAMDTAGAMLGPLVAAGILWFTASAYDAVFVVSFCFALIGLAVIISFVRNPARTPSPDNKKANFAEAMKLLAEPRFRALLLVGSLLSLATLSDSLLHLTMQRKLNLSAGAFPLLYVVIAFIYMLLAVPLGRLADRVGRKRLFIIGYGFLGVAYAMVLLPGASMVGLAAYVALFGLYYAATDGVLTALVSSLLPDHVRTSGLALFTTATGLARLLASVAFGAAWGWLGATQAVWVFLIGLAVAIVIAIVMLRKS